MTVARCAYCDREFIRRRTDHRFCSPEHRKLGERKPYAPPPADPAVVDLLFDPARDPAEMVGPNDWFPEPAGAEWRSLFACETLETRRRWYRALAEIRRL